MKKTRIFSQNQTAPNTPDRERLLFAAGLDPLQVYEFLGTTAQGLSAGAVEASRETWGDNNVSRGKKESLAKRIAKAFFDPFTAILVVLAGVSAFTDILMAQPGEKNPATVIIITAMILISGCLRFVQETRSGNAAAKLAQMIRSTQVVVRICPWSRWWWAMWCIFRQVIWCPPTCASYMPRICSSANRPLPARASPWKNGQPAAAPTIPSPKMKRLPLWAPP